MIRFSNYFAQVAVVFGFAAGIYAGLSSDLTKIFESPILPITLLAMAALAILAGVLRKANTMGEALKPLILSILAFVLTFGILQLLRLFLAR